MPTAMPTAAARGHEHPAARKRGNEGGYESCADNLIEIHQNAPKGKDAATRGTGGSAAILEGAKMGR